MTAAAMAPMISRRRSRGWRRTSGVIGTAPPGPVGEPALHRRVARPRPPAAARRAGGWTPGGRSQPAFRRNCSRSRPLVTGEVNSTPSKVGEASSRAMSWEALLAKPASSRPLRSTETLVSQTSWGRSSVSSRSSGSARRCWVSKLRSVSTSRRARSTACESCSASRTRGASSASAASSAASRRSSRSMVTAGTASARSSASAASPAVTATGQGNGRGRDLLRHEVGAQDPGVRTTERHGQRGEEPRIVGHPGHPRGRPDRGVQRQLRPVRDRERTGSDGGHVGDALAVFRPEAPEAPPQLLGQRVRRAPCRWGAGGRPGSGGDGRRG